MSEELDIKISKILAITSFTSIIKLILCLILVSSITFCIGYPVEHTIFNFIICVLLCMTLIGMTLLSYYGIQMFTEKYIKKILLDNNGIKNDEI